MVIRRSYEERGVRLKLVVVAAVINFFNCYFHAVLVAVWVFHQFQFYHLLFPVTAAPGTSLPRGLGWCQMGTSEN